MRARSGGGGRPRREPAATRDRGARRAQGRAARRAGASNTRCCFLAPPTDSCVSRPLSAGDRVRRAPAGDRARARTRRSRSRTSRRSSPPARRRRASRRPIRTCGRSCCSARPSVRPLEPRECVAIEDSRWGLESARAAGLRTDRRRAHVSGRGAGRRRGGRRPGCPDVGICVQCGTAQGRVAIIQGRTPNLVRVFESPVESLPSGQFFSPHTRP